MIADLDRLSISQKIDARLGGYDASISESLEREVARIKYQSEQAQAEACAKNAPYICYQESPGQWVLTQGCCNDWTCPRCGHIRARTEYGRMVEGAQTLADDGYTLYFWTITCRGRSLTVGEAERDYMKWTNRLLTACRARCKREVGYWCYAQVTEHQKRGHPHSHFISTFAPSDVTPFAKDERLPNGAIAKHDGLWSQWFHDRNVSAGLGPMCDLSEINRPYAVAAYLSKYLFKELIYQEWPPSWKRIRYSQNWPKTALSEVESNGFAVLTMSDWHRVNRLPSVRAADMHVYRSALARLITSVKKPDKCPIVDTCPET